MKWEALVDKAKKKNIEVKPLQHAWWSRYHARLTVQRGPRGRAHKTTRSSGLFLATDIKTRFPGVKRTRVEGGSVGIFFEDATGVSRVMDHIDQHQPDFRMVELTCPVSEAHVAATSADFPTVVRETLFQNKYRYRVVAQVGYGYRQDSTRLDDIMDEWQRWSHEGMGEISKGARYRWTARANYIHHPNMYEYRWSGIMSFYTNDQQLSFLMAMSYPEFYNKTEKVVLINELGDGDGKGKEADVKVQAVGTGDLLQQP